MKLYKNTSDVIGQRTILTLRSDILNMTSPLVAQLIADSIANEATVPISKYIQTN